MILANLCIVLVEPQGPLNIGSVCRAMLNFGFSELRLVNPQADHLSDDARRMAVKATPLLEKATIFHSLREALADCHFAMATTRRFGKYREDFLLPAQAAEYMLPMTHDAKTALVFGREDHGLFTSELELCQRLITIPTEKKLPSMNLAQAVTICLYEFHNAAKSRAINHPPGKKSTASGEKIEAMIQHMRNTLLEIRYLDPQNPDHILRAFRQLFGRARLDDRDVQIFQGLWSRIDWIESERRKNQHSTF